MTPRFREFFAEAWKLYGPSDMTEEEYKVTEQEYRKKWEGVYPLKEDDIALFGVGNGETISLYDLKITHKEGLTYDVYINYNYQHMASNKITLVPHEDSFRIDYATLEWLTSSPRGEEGEKPFYTSEEREAKAKEFETLVQNNAGNYYEALLAELKEFVTPQVTMEKWGSPAFESMLPYSEDDYYYQGCGVIHSLFYTYDAFSASWFVYKENEDFDQEPFLSEFKTNRKGFGFGSIYVGVPECNKVTVMSYLKRWFTEDKLNLYPKEDYADEWLSVSLGGELPVEMIICFSEDGLVSSISFYNGGCL